MPSTTRQRINISLPASTVQLLDHVAPKRDRSRLIDHAVRFFVETKGRSQLKKMLRAGAFERAERDRTLAAEWFRLGDA